MALDWMPEEISDQCLLKSLNTSIRYQKHFLSTMFLCLCVCTQIYLVQCHYSAFLIAFTFMHLADLSKVT